MRITKIFILLTLVLGVGFWGCTKEQKTEAPKREQIIKDLVPPKAEVKSENFLVELSNLKVSTTVDTTSKEIVETPRLNGGIKITNTSKDVLDIQAVTIEYLDGSGTPIAFSSGEKIAKVSPFWHALKPGEVSETTLYDLTIPRNAIKEKTLAKIEINLVYVSTPLKRENLTLPEKVE